MIRTLLFLPTFSFFLSCRSHTDQEPYAPELLSSTYSKYVLEDANREITRLYFAQKLHDEPVVSQVSKIAETYGFEIDFIDKYGIWLENYISRDSRGALWFPNTRDEVRSALIEYSQLMFSNSVGSGGGRGYQGSGFDVVPRKLKTGEFLTSLYIEPGNLFVARNKHGIRKAIVGEATVLINALLLRFTNSSAVHSDDFANKADAGTVGKIDNLLKQGIDIYEDLLTQIRENLETCKHVNPPPLGINCGTTERNAVSRILENPLFPSNYKSLQDDKKTDFTREFSKYWMMSLLQLSKELNVSPENLVVLPQLFWHLDVFMRFGKQGDVFIQDFSKTPEGFFPEQRWYHNSLIDGHQEILDAAYKILAEHRFNVINIPGIYFRFDPKEKPMNFFNGIMGYSKKLNKTFYITDSSENNEIDNWFRGLLASKGYEVEFVVHDFFEKNGGLDCLTVEEVNEL